MTVAISLEERKAVAAAHHGTTLAFSRNLLPSSSRRHSGFDARHRRERRLSTGSAAKFTVADAVGENHP